MVADGSGVYTKALGLDVGYGKIGGGTRRRASMLIEDGIIKELNLHASTRPEASNDETRLAQIA